MPYGNSYMVPGDNGKCVVCGGAIPVYRGSFNVGRTSLCQDPACKLARKTRLQRERRLAARQPKRKRRS